MIRPIPFIVILKSYFHKWSFLLTFFWKMVDQLSWSGVILDFRFLFWWNFFLTSTSNKSTTVLELHLWVKYSFCIAIDTDFNNVTCRIYSYFVALFLVHLHNFAELNFTSLMLERSFLEVSFSKRFVLVSQESKSLVLKLSATESDD